MDCIKRSKSIKSSLSSWNLIAYILRCSQAVPESVLCLERWALGIGQLPDHATRQVTTVRPRFGQANAVYEAGLHRISEAWGSIEGRGNDWCCDAVAIPYLPLQGMKEWDVK